MSSLPIQTENQMIKEESNKKPVSEHERMKVKQGQVYSHRSYRKTSFILIRMFIYDFVAETKSFTSFSLFEECACSKLQGRDTAEE